MEYPTRKGIRLQNFDYSSVSYYFLTVCSYEKRCIFGSLSRDSEIGAIVREELKEIPNRYDGVMLDHYVIMPNHIHMILVLEGETFFHPDVSHIVSCFKAGVTRKIRKKYPNLKVWQRTFYDHIIRGKEDYENIWNYIENNPLKWEEDRFHVDM